MRETRLLPLLIAALAAAALPGKAADLAQAGPRGCRSPTAPSFVVGLPQEAILSQRSWQGACLRFTIGSVYQRLDWLENGKLDAALLPPFALALLEESPGADYCVLGGPFSRITPHHYELRREGGRARRDDPAAALAASLADPQSRLPIVVESHLSDGLVQLVQAAAGWLGREAAADGAVWRRFRDRLRFARPLVPPEDGYFEVSRTEGGAASCDDPATVCLGEDPLVDVVVARAASLAGPLAGAVCRDAPAAGWRERLPREWDEGHPIVDFLRHNLEAHPRGFLTRRHYRFTLDEVWSILAEEGSAGAAGSVALVLTGGGVKAAYQTQIVDHLYRRGYLYNRHDLRLERGQPLRVESVVGTSGGALLGVFVAAIDWRLGEATAETGSLAASEDPAAPPSLVETLWMKGERHVESGDIFPGIDMLRFASLLWGGIVFGLVCVLALLVKPWRRRLLPAADPARPGPRMDVREGGRARWSTGPWLALLGLSPWVIKGITGETGFEHIPAVSGFFYSAYIFLAIYSDQLHVFDGKASAGGRLRSTLWLCGLGAALTIGPFLIPADSRLRGEPLELPGLGFVTVPTLLVSLGFLVLALAIHRQAGSRAGTVDLRKLRSAGGLLVFVPLVVYAVLWLVGIEFFELSTRFWFWLTLGVVAGTAAVLVLGRWRRSPAAVRHRIGGGLDVLLVRHPAASLLGMRRSSRALLCFSCAWLWWNFVNAPALYGNERAKSYFQEALAAFAGEPEVDLDDCFVEFQAPLIITATSLGREREVYFLADPGEEASLADRPEIASDPRWVSVGPAMRNGDLGALAFASGSPFPVFPMTRVKRTPIARQCPGPRAEPAAAGETPVDPHAEDEEWLIDGGYAHNMPIDAARQLGARRVLVLSSSPLHPIEEEGHEALAAGENGRPGAEGARPWRPHPLSVGRLIMGAPRLLPYLYTRSQVEDTLGTEDLLVAALSPVVPAGASWPLLVDFYEEPLKLVIETASDNLRQDARIGTIESWGQPVCRLAGVPVACAELRRGQGEP